MFSYWHKFEQIKNLEKNHWYHQLLQLAFCKKLFTVQITNKNNQTCVRSLTCDTTDESATFSSLVAVSAEMGFCSCIGWTGAFSMVTSCNGMSCMADCAILMAVLLVVVMPLSCCCALLLGALIFFKQVGKSHNT